MMRVKELIEKLQQFDPELPVELWIPSDNNLADVDTVALAKSGETLYTSGAVHINARYF